MGLLDAIDKLNIWKRKDQRAPHKPLLLLYALAGYSRDRNAKFEFSQVDEDLQELLNEFWKPRTGRHTVENPFWRLQKDKIWKVSSDGELDLDSSNPPSSSYLKKHAATGFFAPEIVSEMNDDSDLARRASQRLLDRYFSESIHQDIMERVGLLYETDYTRKVPEKIKRDPKFRGNVLHAYEYRCAVCGFDLRIKTLPVGLEAAHIKWHQYKGPDTEDNGLALCSTHHKLLDGGALTLSEDYRIILSEWIYSPNDSSGFIETHQKRRIRLPRNKKHRPNPDYVEWHRKEVFKEPAIEVST